LFQSPYFMNHDLPPCEIITKDYHDDARRLIGIDLKKPVDLSQMDIHNVSSDTSMDYNKMEFIKTVQLHTYHINEFGDRDEISILIEVKSPKRFSAK
jgi:hypothetical protein